MISTGTYAGVGRKLQGLSALGGVRNALCDERSRASRPHPDHQYEAGIISPIVVSICSLAVASGLPGHRLIPQW
jgi:hypothetical protein